MKYILLFCFFGCLVGCGSIGRMRLPKYHAFVALSKPEVIIIRGITDSLEIQIPEEKTYRVAIPLHYTHIKKIGRVSCVLTTPPQFHDLVFVYKTREWFDRKKIP